MGRPVAKTPRDYSPAELAELRQIVNSRARLLSRTEVAALRGSCTESIKRAERNGLRVLKINSRVTRYRPEDVAAYFDAALVA
jgi:hypothetical protein